MNKTALAISAALTAIILVLVAGIIYSTSAAANSETTPTVDNQTLQAFQERDAAYQALIEKANTQLTELQTQNEQLRASLPTPGAAVQDTSQVTQVSPEQAASVASNWIGETQVYSVENVDWLGAPAYRVVFSSGAIVIVGVDGQVLAVQLAPSFDSESSSYGSDSSGGIWSPGP